MGSVSNIQLLETSGVQNEVQNKPKTCLIRRVKEFQLCGRSAQMLVLENGGWNRLEEWLCEAIRSQKSDVIKRILETVLVMPTSSSKLTKYKLTMTVQRLIYALRGKLPKPILEKVGKVEQQMILQLSLEVVVRWFKLKKCNHEEEEDLNRMILTDAVTKENVAIVSLEHRIGYGLMAFNGQIFYVDLNQIPMRILRRNPKIVQDIEPLSTAPINYSIGN